MISFQLINESVPGGGVVADTVVASHVDVQFEPRRVGVARGQSKRPAVLVFGQPSKLGVFVARRDVIDGHTP